MNTSRAWRVYDAVASVVAVSVTAVMVVAIVFAAIGIVGGAI